MITGILPSWNAATGSLLSAASRSVSRVWRDPVETGTLARSRIGALSVCRHLSRQRALTDRCRRFDENDLLLDDRWVLPRNIQSWRDEWPWRLRDEEVSCLANLREMDGAAQHVNEYVQRNFRHRWLLRAKAFRDWRSVVPSFALSAPRIWQRCSGRSPVWAEHPTLSMMSRSGRKARPIPRRRSSWETRGLRQAPPVYSPIHGDAAIGSLLERSGH